MGIIIGDTITLDNGLSAQNTYGSFGESVLTVEKNLYPVENTTNEEGETIDQNTTSDFRVTCKGNIWTTKQYRDNSNPRIHAVNISINVQSSDLNSNLYGLLYSSWKSKYTTVSDSTD